jgi:hypothetical protein
MLSTVRPDWKSFSDNLVLPLSCICGAKLYTMEDVNWHWQWGHFDFQVDVSKENQVHAEYNISEKFENILQDLHYMKEMEKHLDKRAIAIVITETEKAYAYYKTFVVNKAE